MKKYIILSLLFPLIASASFDHDLFYGLRQDPQVTELQEFLTTQGVYTGPITGNFFSLTQKAVKDFQTANLIFSTGYFGPLTRAKTNSLLSAVTDESGASISPAITPPKTTDDLVAKLTEQITILQQQLAELQKQQAVLMEQNQKLGAIQTQVTEQQQTLTQIQTNTIPPPPITPTQRQLQEEAIRKDYMLKVIALNQQLMEAEQLTGSGDTNSKEILRIYGNSSSIEFPTFADTAFKKQLVTKVYIYLDTINPVARSSGHVIESLRNELLTLNNQRTLLDQERQKAILELP